MELKTIQIDKILANFSQPREHFDKEKVKELAESILSNGLINPITVRADPKRKGKYMIVAGERRWQAHRFAGLKTIQAFVKEYNDDGQWMVESLIENVHRENLGTMERAKYLKKIADMEKIYHLVDGSAHKRGDINITQLAERVKMNRDTVSDDLSLLGFEPGKIMNHSRTNLVRIASIKEKSLQEEVLEKTRGKSSDEVSKVVSTIKKAPEEVKQALLDDKITVEQAENISKIKSDKARQNALKQVEQHRKQADIIPKISENEKPEITDSAKRKMQTVQKIIFNYLNEAKVGIIKSNKGLSNANKMLSDLMQRPFEYGLEDKTLKLSINQLQSISDKISEFNLNLERFEELKEVIIERIEDKE